MGYRTVKTESVAELVEKKSRFIARVCPVSTEQEALDFLAMVKAENRTASHNVFAYRLRERNLSRYSDDGEPSGTAGLPVLDILDRGDITDTVKPRRTGRHDLDRAGYPLQGHLRVSGL